MAKPPKTQPAQPFQTGAGQYVVAAKAPEKIAGRRVQPGEKLTLTEEQARFDELAGHITRLPDPAPSNGQ